MMVHKKEKGQTIVLVVIVIFGLVAMAALMVDGGNAYFNRRDAQTAADAGALAGVYAYCVKRETSTYVESEIRDYVELQNQAKLEGWYIDPETRYLVVDTSKEQTNFFAKIFGMSTTTVYASASAGCFPPGIGTGLLPIAWYCQNPDLEESAWSDSDECVYKSLDYDELQDLLLGPNRDGTFGTVTVDGIEYSAPYAFRGPESGFLPEIYIMMNSDPLSEDVGDWCKPDGTLECDINGDGKDDFQSSGDTSWLDLDGKGSIDLSDITEGFDGDLAPHYWVPSQTGVAENIYIQGIKTKVGEIVLIPVFNQFCNGHPLNDPVEPGCVAAAHVEIAPPSPPLVEYEVPTSASSPIYYHIAGFAAFYVSCVDLPSLGDEGDCPGHRAALAAGSIKDSTTTVEGYFISGYPMNTAGGTGGIDLGVYVLSLTE